MQFLYEFLPVLLFFISFKWYGIYVATVVGILSTLVQVILNRLIKKSWDKKQLITLFIFTFFGGLTLYFHNPIFVKWKPTIVFWIFASVIFISQIIYKRPLMQSMMKSMLEETVVIPTEVWRRINMIWGFYFTVIGALNLYIAYTFSIDAWVNFKFYGITISLFLVSLVQGVYIMNYANVKNKDEHHGA